MENSKGFTLTELVVGMGVFLIAITLAVGSFVRTLKTQRIVNHLMSVNSNASIALEQIAREIRTSYDFSLPNTPQACSGSQRDELQFINQKDKKVTYKLSNGAIAKRECPVGEANNLCNARVFESLTASNVLVSRLCFLETQAGNNDPWRITLFLQVGSSNPDLASNVLNLQTTISSRLLPVDVQ